jgi:hypothetical protein
MLQRLESTNVTMEVLQTTLIGTVVSRFKKHPELGPLAKGLVKKWKAIAAAAAAGGTGTVSGGGTVSGAKEAAAAAIQPHKATNTKTNTKTTAKKMGKQQQQQHSFFNPRSSKSKPPKSITVNHPFFAPRKRTLSATMADAVLAETKSLKRKLPQGAVGGTSVSASVSASTVATTERLPASSKSRPNTTNTNSTSTTTILSPETTKAVAAIFHNKSTKQILAEQRQIELAANRALLAKAKANAHPTANCKTATRNRPSSYNNNSTNNNNNNSNNSTNNSNSTNNNKPCKSLLLPVAPRFPVPNHVGAVDETMHGEHARTPMELSEDHPLRSLPLSFPFPLSLPTPNDALSTTATTSATTTTSWLSSPSALDTFDVGTTTFTAIQRALFDTFSILPLNHKDNANHTNHTNNTKNANNTTNTNNVSNTNNHNHNNNARHPTSPIWNNKTVFQFGGRMDKDSIVGDRPQEVFRELTEFIDHWRVARNESLERTAERHRKLLARSRSGKGKSNGRSFKGRTSKGRGRPKKKTKTTKPSKYYGYTYDNDDDWLVGDSDDDDEEDDPLMMAPLCLLTGPSASGKTAMVRAVAKHCGNCKVLEINTSRARSGAALKHAIEEATQSNSSLEMLQNKSHKTNGEGKGFFAAAKRDLVDSDDDEDTSDEDHSDSDDDDSCQEEKKKSSVTIVLIDEVDILFEETGDAGFWTALGALARATKCPIVLTANTCPPQLDPSQSSRGSAQLPCKRFCLEKPTPDDCASMLWRILRQQQQNGSNRAILTISPAVQSRGPAAIRNSLAAIAESCDCDLRKLLHELQVFVALSGSRLDIPPTAAAGRSMASGKENIIISGCSDNTNTASHSLLHKQIPTVVSVGPTRVPMEKHSIVTAKGTNFSILKEDTDQSHNRIRIGPLAVTKWHVVDNETLLLLCPPYDTAQADSNWAADPTGRWAKRILPLTIDCGYGTSFSRIAVSETLADGTQLPGTQFPTIEYVLPEMDDAKDNGNGEDAEFQFEKDNATNTQPEKHALPPVKNARNEANGGWLVAWTTAIANTKSSTDSDCTMAIPSLRTRPTSNDAAMASELDFLADRARDLSDASLLDELGDGLPYLSGACRGFAYDHTEDGCASYKNQAIGAETLKMHEKSKP